MLRNQFILDSLSYRLPCFVTKAKQLTSGYYYAICPRCNITLERDYANYCDRCGQHLSWVFYDYLQFVKRTYPTIKQALEHEYEFYSHNNYFECLQCKYRGPSKYQNVCPKCGKAVDD